VGSAEAMVRSRDNHVGSMREHIHVYGRRFLFVLLLRDFNGPQPEGAGRADRNVDVSRGSIWAGLAIRCQDSVSFLPEFFTQSRFQSIFRERKCFGVLAFLQKECHLIFVGPHHQRLVPREFWRGWIEGMMRKVGPIHYRRESAWTRNHHAFSAGT